MHTQSQARKSALEGSRLYFQFLQDAEEEEAWLVETIRLARSEEVGKDLDSCTLLLKRHEVGLNKYFPVFSKFLPYIFIFLLHKSEFNSPRRPWKEK